MSRLMAATYDRFTARTEAAGLAEWRRDLLADLHGEVLEIGAGTGHNLRWYPPTVTGLVVTEPDPYMRTRLDARVSDARGPEVITVVDHPAERLHFDDASFDAVVSTLVLCSVSDPEATLAEIFRVLRPGGRLVYLEHVAAIDAPRTLRWQRRFEPVWRLVADNCHLTRSTEQAITAAGFEVTVERRQAMPLAPPVLRTTVRGTAVRPAVPS